MAYQSRFTPPRLPTAGSSDSDDLVENIYDLLQVPASKREQLYPQISNLLNSRRPDSVASFQTCSTSSNASYLSKRSTQISQASSRTSYSSDVYDAFPQHGQWNASHPSPVMSKEAPGLPPASLAVQSEEPSTPSDSNSRADNRASSKHPLHQCRCPWCDQGFTRPHDFRKHVKKYCEGLSFWICRNEACRNSAYSETQAKRHRNQEGAPTCKLLGWHKVELSFGRRNFGCSHCATYFNNLDAYLEHLSKDCSPRASSRGHRSHQIRALLQQPELKPHVEALCLQFRGSVNAYKNLWWCWKRDVMAKIVGQLEYGVKDAPITPENPGIYSQRLDIFLRKLILPSNFSRDVSEILPSSTSSMPPPPPPPPPPSTTPSTTTTFQKPLPPLPETDTLPQTSMSEDVPQQRGYVQTFSNFADCDDLADRMDYIPTPASTVLDQMDHIPPGTKVRPPEVQPPDLSMDTGHPPPPQPPPPAPPASAPFLDRSGAHETSAQMIHHQNIFTWDHLATNGMSDATQADAIWAPIMCIDEMSDLQPQHAHPTGPMMQNNVAYARTSSAPAHEAVNVLWATNQGISH